MTELRDYAPFGEELGAGVGPRPGGSTLYQGLAYPSVTADGNNVNFTGKERDAESGLDYFGARYMSSAQGRFTSPDAPFADQHLENPQSWNLYAYTLNNPLAYVDPNGFEVRPAELARAEQQINDLNPGDRYTIAFMGVTTDNSLGGDYLTGKNPTAVPGYSNQYGLGELNATNTAILSNSNGWINALPGDVDRDQVDTANAIYDAANARGLGIDILTHSNGVNGAGAFAPGKEINTALVVAPNTRSTAAMMNIVKCQFSDYDLAERKRYGT